MTTYPRKWVARVKGALRAGFKPKQLAYLTGIPIDTIRSWAKEQAMAAIEADSDVREDLRVALLKEN